MPKTKSKYRTDYRDSRTGEFISKKKALKRPAFSVAEKRLRKKAK